MSLKRDKELKALRQRLVGIFMSPAADLNEVEATNKRLRKLITEMKLDGSYDERQVTLPAPKKRILKPRVPVDPRQATLDKIAMAIGLAAAKTGGCPLLIASGAKFDVNTAQHGRARTYAAFAIQKAFPGMAAPMIALLVGVSKKSHESYFSSMRQRMRKGSMDWFDQGVVDEIANALEVGCELITAEAVKDDIAKQIVIAA